MTSKNGLREYIMALVYADIFGDHQLIMTSRSGRDWYRQYIDNTICNSTMPTYKYIVDVIQLRNNGYAHCIVRRTSNGLFTYVSQIRGFY